MIMRPRDAVIERLRQRSDATLGSRSPSAAVRQLKSIRIMIADVFQAEIWTSRPLSSLRWEPKNFLQNGLGFTQGSPNLHEG